jgi:hypothetical protein
LLLDRDFLDVAPLDGEGRVIDAANGEMQPAFYAHTGMSVAITAFSPVIAANFTAVTAMTIRLIPTINIDTLLTSATVKRAMSDKMATATFEFDKVTVANITSTLFWTKLVMRIPDYTGTWNTVFSGIAPSGQTNITWDKTLYTPIGNQSVTAYDYSWYLTAQKIESDDRVLLKWADQQTDLIYRLDYKDRSANPITTGDRLYGATSGDSGTIVEDYSGSTYVRLKAMIGSAPYFQDSESLFVGCSFSGGGPTIGKADGAAVDDTGTVYQRYPTNYVAKLLGGWQGGNNYGAKWAEMTGIYPKYFGSDASWVEKEFSFEVTTTKAEAIEEICQYMKWIFYIRYETVSGTPAVPCAYFFPETDLDTVGCLPDPVYVTNGSSRAAPPYANDAGGYMITPFKLDANGETQYNWIEVRCQAIYNGNWYDSKVYDSDVYDPVLNSTGTIPKVPYYEVNPTIATQSDCTARAANLALYYTKQILTWTATFELRSDFVLLQKLIVSGFGDSYLPDDDYRIIDISYDYNNAGTYNFVTVKIIKDDDFRAYLNLKRVYLNSIYEIQNIAKNLIDKSIVNATGVVISRVERTCLIAVNGSYGSVKRTAYDDSRSLAAGNKVLLTLGTDGQLLVVKTST